MIHEASFQLLDKIPSKFWHTYNLVPTAVIVVAFWKQEPLTQRKKSCETYFPWSFFMICFFFIVKGFCRCWMCEVQAKSPCQQFTACSSLSKFFFHQTTVRGISWLIQKEKKIWGNFFWINWCLQAKMKDSKTCQSFFWIN